MPYKDPPHGKLQKWIAGCRCETCTETHRAHAMRPPERAAYLAEWRRNHPGYMAEANRRWRQEHFGQEPPRHGLSGYVGYGCRCPICVDAQSAYQKARRAKQKAAAS